MNLKEQLYESLWLLNEAEKDESTDSGETEVEAPSTSEPEETSETETPPESSDQPSVETNSDTEEGVPDNGGVDDIEDAQQTQSEKNKKLILFDNYRDIYSSINGFIDSVDKYKEHLNQKDESIITLDFIEDKLYKLKDNVKQMITDKIMTLSYEKSRIIFIHVKTEINLMIKLFEKISTKEQ